jgi:outer membrane immunogenic protein
VLGGDIAYNRMSHARTSATDSIARRVTLTSSGDVDDVTINASSSLTLIDYATFRGRAGYAFGQFLPYAILGGAIGRFNYMTTSTVNLVQNSVQATGFPATQTDSQNNKLGFGFLYGLGMDVAITPNIFVRGEWEAVAFAKVGDIHSTLNTARVGLGVRF